MAQLQHTYALSLQTFNLKVSAISFAEAYWSAVAAVSLLAAVPVVVVNLPAMSLQVPGVVAVGFSIAVHSGPAVDQTAAWQALLHYSGVAGGILEA